MEVKRGSNPDKVLQKQEDERQAREEITLSGFPEKNYQQIEDWIDEITSLAVAKQKLKVMAKVILAIIKTRD